MIRRRDWRVETSADVLDPVCVRIAAPTDDGRSVETEIAPPYRLRVRDSNGPILWAAGHPALWGLVVLLERPHPALPHFRADECRRIRDRSEHEADWWTAWALRFAIALKESGPIGRGNWILERAHVSDDPTASSLRGLSLRVIDRSTRDERIGKVVEIDWGLGGENPMLAMRELASSDDGRLKALVKLAATGELPPALVWWHSGLQRHVILDGHVRLEAFRRAAKPPVAIVLAEQRVARGAAENEETVTRRAAAAARSIADVDVRNRVVSDLYAQVQMFEHATSAVRYRGGSAAWDADVAARSPDFDTRVSKLLASQL